MVRFLLCPTHLKMPTMNVPRWRWVTGGRIVLPATLRKRLDLQEGDRLILTVEKDGSVRLTPAKRVVERLRGRFADPASPSLTNELIARKGCAEAARE